MLDFQPRIKIFLFLLPTYIEKLLSTPKITFLPHSLPLHENSERTSNPMPLPLYPYLSRLTLLINFTILNKQLSNVKSVFKSLDHVSSSKVIYKFTTLLWIKYILSCIKQFPLNQGSFIHQMEWAPSKNLFWNTNDSIANLAMSFTSGVSLRDRNMLIYDSNSLCQKLTKI